MTEELCLYEPEYLERWARSEGYGGEDYRDWYVVHSQNRDSGLLEQSNHAVIWRTLEPLNTDTNNLDSVQDMRFGHWAVGWVDVIMVHETNTAALQEADELVAALGDYPVLDEEDLGQREQEAAADRWERMSVADRIEAMVGCMEHWIQQGVVSIFSARRDELPEDPQGALMEYLANGY